MRTPTCLPLLLPAEPAEAKVSGRLTMAEAAHLAAKVMFKASASAG